MGFRHKQNTSTASLKFTQDIKLALDKKEISLMVFFDFSKAFDTVNHKLLINKPSTLSFSMSALTWFESSFSGRIFRVTNSKRTSSD